MNQLRAICARMHGNELVAAECLNLTGGIPDAEGVAICTDITLVPRSAYITFGLHCYAEAQNLIALADEVAQIPISADRFRIEFLRLSNNLPVSKQEAIRTIADALQAYPDLTSPLHRFLVVVQHDKVWFGENLAEGQHTYTRHGNKPHHTSSSLPARLARALVNLVSPPARSILDPFCGTGSILLEAQALGLAAYGTDKNSKMVSMSRRNLRQYGYSGEVIVGDAVDCRQTADALVTDLPYGRLLKANQTNLPEIFMHLRQLAPEAVYIAEEDLSNLLQQAGYPRVDCWQVRKHARMSRLIHLAR